MENIVKIKTDPINTLKTLNKKEILNILEEADKAFFNTSETLFNDDIYDIVKNYFKSIDPKNPYFKRVGADELHKVKLPYWLGSLDKIKDDRNEIIKWKKKYIGNYIISEKLDGISCLFNYDNDKLSVYTRGNGEEGQDISHILTYIENTNNIENLKKIHNKYSIRGELIISRENWELIKDKGSNARNVVAGSIHSKIINKEIMNKIEFIAYDILYPRMKIEDCFEFFKNNNIKCAKSIKLDDIDIDIDILSDILQKWRKTSKYDIDGIVITHNDIHKLANGKNPKYSFAFKSILTHIQAEVIVTDVEWNISKDKYIKPIIKFNEIVLSGVKIKQATGFNANYIETNKIGAGSHLIIIRSGDVIPHIHKVLKESATGEAKMPNVPYIWNETHIDILLDSNEKNREQDIKSYLYFIKTLEVEYIGEGIIVKLYDAGYDSLYKIINIKEEELLKIDGFKEKIANKIITSLKKIQDVSCEKLLNASNVLGRGFGERKIKLILDVYPDLLEIENKDKSLKLTIEDIIKIEGFSKITATNFIKNLPKYYELYDELGINCNKKQKTTHSNEKSSSVSPKKTEIEKLKDISFVFSGFRNKEYEKIIISNGGIISNTITKKTTYLVVKDITEETGKITKARKENIKIISIEELEEMLSKL